MLDYELDDAVDFGINAFDSAGVRVWHPASASDVVEAKAAVAEEASRPREGLDFAGVEAAVHEFGQIFASRSVAAGEGEGRQQRSQPGQGGVGVQFVQPRVCVITSCIITSCIRTGKPDAERGRCLRDRVADGDSLLGAADRPDRLREGRGTSVDDDHGVEVHGVGDQVDLVRRRQPHRGERARQVRGGRMKLFGADLVATQGTLQLRRLFRPVDEADTPVLGELPGEQLRAACGVRFVDKPEVCFEPVEYRSVRS